MTWNCKYFFHFFTFIFFSLGANFDVPIRVLLNEYSTNNNLNFSLFSDKKLFAEVAVKNNTLFARKAKGRLRKIKNNALRVEHYLPLSLSEGPKGSQKPTPYEGTISFHLDQKKQTLYVVNRLDLEDYVYAVLQAEGYQDPGVWPPRMQELQAIVSRSYAINQMHAQRTKNKQSLYDIKGTNYHQRYNGNRGYSHLRKAVAKTRGIVLAHEQGVILAMFDACCGGSVPANIHGLHFDKAPYLARKYPCQYCKNYKLYSWEKRMPIRRFLESLYAYKPIAAKLSKDRKLHEIAVAKKDKAGLVQAVTLSQTPKKKVSIGGKEFRASMGAFMRSLHYTVKKEGNVVRIAGHGFGHLVGLCQRGACELIRRGWPIKKILSFYYPNTRLARLNTMGG